MAKFGSITVKKVRGKDKIIIQFDGNEVRIAGEGHVFVKPACDRSIITGDYPGASVSVFLNGFPKEK